MKPFKADRQIKDASDFEEYASEAFSEFLEDFSHRGLTRDVTEDDCVGEECSFIYTTRGMKLAERFQDRMAKLGGLHFPDETFDISSMLYQEY